MSYENAPATKMIATHCACCGRPLLDAASVEAGVGPDCREKHGYAEAQGVPDWDGVMFALDGFVAVADVNPEMEPRAAANKLVHDIAVEQAGEGVAVRLVALRALGFEKLASRIAKRIQVVTVKAEGDKLVVRAPYNESFNALARGVPGSRGHKNGKDFFRTFPASSRRMLWDAIKSAFPQGTLVEGDRGFAVL